MTHALAIDIGGTKIEAGIVSADGVIERRERVASTHAADAEELFARVADVVAAVRRDDLAFVSGVANLSRIVTLHDFDIEPEDSVTNLKMTIEAKT